MSPPIHTILGTALEAARSALRELDGDQIPNDLRRVAGYAGALPPPLAKSLLKGLEQYEWLREKAVRQLEVATGDRAEAAVLFLERPEGWEIRLAEIAVRAGGTAADEVGRAAAARERDLQGALRAAKEKARTEHRESRAAAAALERRVAELSAAQKAGAAGDARDQRDATRAIEAVRAVAAGCLEERDAAIEAARLAKLDLLKERALRRRAEAAVAAVSATGGWREDPAGLAARLDETALMARPPARTRPAPAVEPLAELRLPGGIAPDERAAIDWLLGLEAAVTVIVDGYNLGYQMQGERTPGPARVRVARLLRQLQRITKGTLKVIVVYDSNLGPAETPLAPGPVTVRYSEAGETADDEIVRLVEARDGQVVVISSDREVRDRSEAAGALSLWGRALVEWAGTR